MFRQISRSCPSLKSQLVALCVINHSSDNFNSHKNHCSDNVFNLFRQFNNHKNHSADNCFSTEYFTFVIKDKTSIRILTEREFKRLFDEHYQPLCNFAFRIIPDMDMVEDVVQDAFVKIWQKGETIDIDQNIKSYLYTMTKNNCLEIIRREGIGRKAVEEIRHAYIIEEGDVNEAEVEKWLLLDKIYVSMRQLPPKCEEVFRLSKVNGLTYTQIAEQLNISVKTVEAHMSKALKILRNLIAET